MEHFIRDSFTTFESLFEESKARRNGALVRLRDSFKTNEFGWNHVEITSHSLYEYANYGFFVFLSIFERKEGEQCQ